MRKPRLLIFAALAAYGHAIGATLPSADVRSGGAVIRVEFSEGDFDLPQSAILTWVQRAADAVTTYYGRFPLPSPTLHINPAEGRGGVFHGTTWGMRGGYIRISVGQHTTEQQLNSDWMLTHEMTHFAFPDVSDQHHWIEEGLATYIEPIARAQAGQLSATKVWQDAMEGMPKGEPGPLDEGLDHTHTWGRTYWGGALFAMLADVEIRECSNNQKGLQDALRAVLDKGGNIQHEWPIENVWKVGDAATGCSVLTQLYAKWKDTPVTVDLPALWRRLGISKEGSHISFDEGAPLARIRLAITAPDHQSVSSATQPAANASR